MSQPSAAFQVFAIKDLFNEIAKMNRPDPMTCSFSEYVHFEYFRPKHNAPRTFTGSNVMNAIKKAIMDDDLDMFKLLTRLNYTQNVGGLFLYHSILHYGGPKGCIGCVSEDCTGRSHTVTKQHITLSMLLSNARKITRYCASSTSSDAFTRIIGSSGYMYELLYKLEYKTYDELETIKEINSLVATVGLRIVRKEHMQRFLKFLIDADQLRTVKKLNLSEDVFRENLNHAGSFIWHVGLVEYVLEKYPSLTDYTRRCAIAAKRLDSVAFIGGLTDADIPDILDSLESGTIQAVEYYWGLLVESPEFKDHAAKLLSKKLEPDAVSWIAGALLALL